MRAWVQGRAGSLPPVRQHYVVCHCYLKPRIVEEMQGSVQAWHEMPKLRTEDTGPLALGSSAVMLRDYGHGILWEAYLGLTRNPGHPLLCPGRELHVARD